MDHPTNTDPQDPNSDDEKVVDPEFCASTSLSTLSLSKGRTEEPKELKLLEILIDKSIKRLEENSCEPRIQDALRAIQLKQKQVKTSEAEKFFWQEIDAIRREELPKLYPEATRPTCCERAEPDSLESQILKTIIGLKDQVRRGILPVKTITDTFNQEKSKESQPEDQAFQLTYHRIGRILSTMGFRKARTGNGASAIIWDEDFIFSLSPSQKTESAIGCDKKEMKPSSETSETSETSESSEVKEVPSTLKGDRQDASPNQVENPSRGAEETKPNLFLCPPRIWKHRYWSSKPVSPIPHR
jgi:hypothetical protein